MDTVKPFYISRSAMPVTSTATVKLGSVGGLLAG